MAAKANSSKKEYVLSTSDRELERLGLQHSLWLSHARRLWWKTGFGGSDQLLDLGCGPGFTTIDLARFAGPGVSITAVDESEKFLNHLSEQANLGGFKKIKTHQTDLAKLDLSKKDYDGAYCRWVMCFVPDPKLVLKNISKHIRPGGLFALQEYVDYRSMNLFPKSKHMSAVVDSIYKNWKSYGGDPDIGQKLPKLLEEVGFKVRHLKPIARIARPHHKLWNWPDSFYKIHIPELEKKGFLGSSDAAGFLAEWNEANKKPGAFFNAPTVMNIIAEKA